MTLNRAQVQDLDAPITRRELVHLLERFASAPPVADVNIEAGIALNELLGIAD